MLVKRHRNLDKLQEENGEDSKTTDNWCNFIVQICHHNNILFLFQRWIQSFALEYLYYYYRRQFYISWQDPGALCNSITVRTSSLWSPIKIIGLISLRSAKALRLNFGHCIYGLRNLCTSTPGILLFVRLANERRRCNVTPSLIGWAHTQNDPCNPRALLYLSDIKQWWRHINVIDIMWNDVQLWCENGRLHIVGTNYVCTQHMHVI